MFDLTGKVAIVTGGNGGIGLGMAEAMAASGADIVIWGTNETKNAAAVEALKAHGTRVAARKVNVASEQEVVDGMKAALAALQAGGKPVDGRRVNDAVRRRLGG